jgi:AcrR family transcriptional regulator
MNRASATKPETVTRPKTGSPRRRAPARRGEGGKLRADIIETTSRLLADEGNPDALSLRAIAREVGVATTSIYLHFPDMESLVTVVKEQHFAELTAQLRAAADRAGEDPFEQLLAMARSYVRYGLDHPGHYRVMFSSTATSLPSDPQRRFIGEEGFDMLRDTVARVADKNDDPTLVAVHCWTAMHGLISLRVRRRKFPWPPIEEQLEDLIRRLVGRRS